jgi:hypothetical protein
MMLLHCLHPKKNNEIYKQIITFSHLYYEECDRAQEIESNFSIVYESFLQVAQVVCIRGYHV